jgi:hypothetical protein
MWDIFLKILAAIFIAAISSWITVQLSLKRFRSERWWEKKVEAYSNLIEVLHNSKAFIHHLNESMKGDRLSEERFNELQKRYKVAKDEIFKSGDIGAFLLSPEAINRLRQYQKEDNEALKKGFLEGLPFSCAATDACLNDIIEIARRDLKAE